MKLKEDHGGVVDKMSESGYIFKQLECVSELVCCTVALASLGA